MDRLHFPKLENMLAEAKSLPGRCHGNDLAITVFLWLCDFYVIRNQLRQLFPAFCKSHLSDFLLDLHDSFCGFPWVETSTAGRVYDLCVYYMTGAPEGSPKVVLCGFMEKPGIEPATPGLQGIALIHYTTGASL